MEEENQETKTLDCVQFEAIPTTEDAPLLKTMENENLSSSNYPQFDEIVTGSSKIDEPQFESNVEESTQERGSETLDLKPQHGIEDANLPETLDKYTEDEEDSGENLDWCPLDKGKSQMDPIFGPLTEEFYKQCEIPYYWQRGNVGSFCGRRFRDFNYRSRGRRPDFIERENESSSVSIQKWNELETEPCQVGAGLANLGNTCFLNAILQCFTHTVPLVQGLKSFKHESSSHGKDEFCVLCAIHDQIEHSLSFSGRVISPYNLVDNLSHISSFFRRYQQEDAHEFLQCLLDKLDSNWSKYEANAKYSSSPDDSLVKQVFGGRLVSQVNCTKCGHSSYTHEPLIDLSLEIEDVDNLESALKSFTKVESIEETEKFTCESCKEQVPVKKQLMLDQAPSVAVLHLKRFKSDGVYVQKIDKAVGYPLELDLEPYTRGSKEGNEDLKYELFAVVVHEGLSSTSGHYFCYIRTSPDTWYRFDDSKVSRVQEATVLREDAYILFYARKGLPWFGSFIEKWETCSDRKISKTSPKSVLDKVDRPFASYHEVETPSSSSDPSHVEVNVIDKAEDELSMGAKDSCIPPSTGLRHVEDAMEECWKDETRRINDEICPESHLENTFDGDAKNDVSMNPSTPPRAPSPDIYSDEERAGVTYSIPIDHLKIEDKISPLSSTKKSIEKAKHDLKRKEAVKYVSKSMPSVRRKFFMAALVGSRSDSSLNKKRRKQTSFLNPQHSPGKRVKISPKRLLRPMTA